MNDGVAGKVNHNKSNYPLSDVNQGVLQRLVDLAPTLKEGELRLLLYLAQLTEKRPQHDIRISKAELASGTKLARSAIERAVAALAQRGLITCRRGTATQASAFIVNIFATVVLGSPLGGQPPLVEAPSKRVTGPLFEGKGHPFRGQPDDENTPVAECVDAVDIEGFDSSSESVIDRLLKANPKRETPERLAEARRWLHGYAAKFGRAPNPHPPDDKICAQFLAIAEWPRLEGVLLDLMGERKEAPHSYAWFVSVALQRIHGIEPKKLRDRRQQLKLVRKHEQLAGNVADPEFSATILDDVYNAVGGLKR
jgi:hypothetical protein